MSACLCADIFSTGTLCPHTNKGRQMKENNIITSRTYSTFQDLLNALPNLSSDISLFDLRIGEAKNSKPLLILNGHHDFVSALKVLPGECMVSGGWHNDSTLRVWDMKTGECILILWGHTSGISDLEILLDGRVISAGDKTLRIWDVTNKEGHCDMVLESYTYVNVLSVLRDGQVISGDMCGGIKVWDVTMGQCTMAFTGHTEGITAFVVLSDGRVVSGSLDQTLKVWDVETWQCTMTLKGHTSGISSLMSWPDGRVVSGGYDNTIKIWDLQNWWGKCDVTLKDHTDSVLDLKVLPDGTRMVSGSKDGTLKVWDVKTMQCVDTLQGCDGTVGSYLVFSHLATFSDGLVVSGSYDSTLKVWSIGPRPLLKEEREQAEKILFTIQQTKKNDDMQVLEVLLRKENVELKTELTQSNQSLQLLKTKGWRKWQETDTKKIQLLLQAEQDVQFVSVIHAIDGLTDVKNLQSKGVITSLFEWETACELAIKAVKEKASKQNKYYLKCLKIGMQVLLTSWENGSLQNQEIRLFWNANALQNLDVLQAPEVLQLRCLGALVYHLENESLKDLYEHLCKLVEKNPQGNKIIRNQYTLVENEIKEALQQHPKCDAIISEAKTAILEAWKLKKLSLLEAKAVENCLVSVKEYWLKKIDEIDYILYPVSSFFPSQKQSNENSENPQCGFIESQQVTPSAPKLELDDQESPKPPSIGNEGFFGKSQILSSEKIQNESDVIPEKKHPKSHFCSITHAVMQDPVLLLETGQTYEQLALEDWFKKNDTCPNTGVILTSKKFIVNYALKDSIAEINEENAKLKQQEFK